MLTVEKLELLFPDFPAPALILAPTNELEVLKVNNAYLNLIGTHPYDFSGRPLFEIFPDDEYENPESVVKRVNRTIQEVLSTKTSHTPGTIAYPLADPQTGCKKLRFFMPEYIPVVNEQGAIEYIFHYTHEITQAAQITHPHLPIIASFEHILHTSQHPFLLTTGEGNVVLANTSACKLFGYTKDEFSRLQRHELLNYKDERVFALLLEREETEVQREKSPLLKKMVNNFLVNTPRPDLLMLTAKCVAAQSLLT